MESREFHVADLFGKNINLPPTPNKKNINDKFQKNE